MKPSRSPRAAALVATLTLAHAAGAFAAAPVAHGANARPASGHGASVHATAPAAVGANDHATAGTADHATAGANDHTSAGATNHTSAGATNHTPAGATAHGSSHHGAAAHATAGARSRESFAAERTPLSLGAAPAKPAHVSASGDGSTIVRTIVGLFIVIAVIYGLAWIMRQFKRGRERGASGTGLSSVATLPLGPNRSLALVRAGRDLLLVGVGEHGVTPIRRYSEEQAIAAGLIGSPDELDDNLVVPTAAVGGGSARWQNVAGGSPGGLLDKVRRWTVRQ